MLTVVMLSVVMPSVVMLSVVMLSVVMSIVVAPLFLLPLSAFPLLFRKHLSNGFPGEPPHGCHDILLNGTQYNDTQRIELIGTLIPILNYCY